MVSEYYKELSMPGFRVCQEDECKSLGELSDGEDSNMELVMSKFAFSHMSVDRVG